MSEQNIVNVMVIPDVPKVLPGEQLYVYVPKASFTSPGIIAYNSEQFEINGNFLRIRDDYVSSGVKQKIAELKEYTDGKLQLKQDKEDDNISLAQRPEQKSVVGAINDLGTLTQEAKNAADQAQATANNAVATANEAKTTAQTAENNANSAVDKADSAIDRANKAYEKAANNVYAVGFMTLEEAITAVNGYDNTVLKTNDNILVVAQGSPDLYVTSVEATSVPYNFTSVDNFNDDLVKNTVLQIGYYKVAFYETDGQPVTVAWQNVVVNNWVASTEFEDFPYEAKIELTDFVDYTTVPQVVFDIADTMSGNYAPICKSGDKCVYIYGKVQNEITLKTVITFAPNVNGASVVGGGYNNRGKWVASTSYAIDDLVYTDNGQYVCIEGITSTTSPEQDTTHWQATFVATGKTKNGLKFSGQNGNGTEVQKTFDGSQAVEVAFDETTMTVKEVDGVLEIGAKGTIPEALPQEAGALKSGNLPTSGWEKTGFQTFWEGTAKCDASAYKPIGTSKELADILYSDNSAYPMVDYNYQYYGNYNKTNVKFSYKNSNASVGSLTGISFRDNYQVDNPTIFIARDGTMYGRGSNFASSAYAVTYTRIGTSTISQQFYTISDSTITANSDILMELNDDGGVKAYSMEAGKITVIRDTVPTQPIPYTYKVKQTNASGQFTLVNHYVPNVPVTSVNGQTGAVTIAVPTKTSDLTNDSGFIKPTEANTFTGEQTFSNENGIKTNRVHNLNGNAWYDFDGTNDRLGSLATPTIIRTSEARPKTEVPSGSGTATKELALLEDVPGALGEWVTVAGETATLTEAGTYQVVFYGGDRNVQSIIYWDGTTAAEGTYSTVVDLLEGRPVMASRFPQITAEGVISFGWVTISQTVQGDWTESNTTASGFKYRKIN